MSKKSTTFAPLSSTAVIIPAMTDGMPYPQLPDPAPVGEPIILLLFALLYVAYKYRRKVKF